MKAEEYSKWPILCQEEEEGKVEQESRWTILPVTEGASLAICCYGPAKLPKVIVAPDQLDYDLFGKRLGHGSRLLWREAVTDLAHIFDDIRRHGGEVRIYKAGDLCLSLRVAHPCASVDVVAYSILVEKVGVETVLTNLRMAQRLIRAIRPMPVVGLVLR